MAKTMEATVKQGECSRYRGQSAGKQKGMLCLFSMAIGINPTLKSLTISMG